MASKGAAAASKSRTALDAAFDDSAGFMTELDMSTFVFNEKRRDDAKVLNRKYLLGKVLGSGATAQVIEVLDLETLQRKVVKVFRVPRRFSLTETPGQKVRQISEEYRILRRFNHQNVIKAYDMFKSQDEWQITLQVVTEYCTGSLEELRLSRPGHKLVLANCHFYFHQLIEGIEFLHSHSIAHGDVKPDNLMIVNDNTLKLVDFGSYVDLGMFPGNVQRGMSLASPYFQPPEGLFPYTSQVVDSAGKAEMCFAADVWSCGVVLFMISCGHHPFMASDQGTQHELYKKITEHPFEQSPVLGKNRALDLLFRMMFRTDFKMRATITDIKRTAWYTISVQPTETAGFAHRFKLNDEGKEEATGDKYRSMTMTAALFQLVRPISESVKVLGKDMPDFEQRKEIPYLRANRSPEPTRSPPLSLFKRIQVKASNLRRRF